MPKNPKHKRRDPSPKFLMEGDVVMAILRPDDPERKLAGIAAIQPGLSHEEAEVVLNGLLNEQPHTFIGYASRECGRILNEYGKIIGFLRGGDSFVGCGGDTLLAPPMFQRERK